MNLEATLFQLIMKDFTIKNVKENEKWGAWVRRYSIYAQHKKENFFVKLVVQFRLGHQVGNQWEQIQIEAAGVSEKENGTYFPYLLHRFSSKEYENYLLRKAVLQLETSIREHPLFRLQLIMNEYELIVEEKTQERIKEVENTKQPSFFKKLQNVWISYGIIMGTIAFGCFFPKELTYGLVTLASIGGVLFLINAFVRSLHRIRYEWRIRREQKIINVEKKTKI